MHQSRFGLHSFDPAQNLSRAMATVLPLLVRHVFLEIVVARPFIVSRKPRLPRCAPNLRSSRPSVSAHQLCGIDLGTTTKPLPQMRPSTLCVTNRMAQQSKKQNLLRLFP
jgi:hypothetical protein